MPRQMVKQKCPYCGRKIKSPAYYRHLATHEGTTKPRAKTTRAAQDGLGSRQQIVAILDEWEALKEENKLLRAKLDGINDIVNMTRG